MHKLITNINNILNHSIAPYKASYTPVALIAIGGFPLYYVIWHYIIIQPYENLPLRLLGSGLTAFCLTERYWSRKLQEFSAMIWYAVLTYCLPFFFTYLLLRNQASTAWLLSEICMIYIALSIMNWISFIVSLLIGIIVAWFFYILTVAHPLPGIRFFHYWPVYLFALLTGGLTKFMIKAYNREKLKTYSTALSICHNIAHELRTPLLGIKAANSALKKTSTTSIACSLIDKQVEQTNFLINNLLTNAQSPQADSGEYQSHSIADCVNSALENYPFKYTADRQLIHWDNQRDFLFYGSNKLLIHILHNLLNNALDSVKQAQKGSIHLWLKQDKSNNELHIKDQGLGISKQAKAHIFERYYTTKKHGFGVGLAFCKQVMESFNGEITVYSEYHYYTEFVLTFPITKITDEHKS